MCVDNFSLRFFMKDVDKRIRDAALYTFICHYIPLTGRKSVIVSFSGLSKNLKFTNSMS